MRHHLGLLAGALLFGCGHDAERARPGVDAQPSTPAPAPAPEPAPGERPSVLLVTLDTTRADHIGAYGYEPAHTPVLDELAAQGTLYERAYSTAPLTIPSHSTILTGRNPPSHGVRDNGDFNLGEDEITLAERFAEAGYTCAAFTSAFPTQARWGFDQGFHVYHDPLERPPTQLDWSDQRRAEEVVDDALETLAPHGGGPLFVWLHFFDPHWPYDPPPPFDPANPSCDALDDTPPEELDERSALRDACDVENYDGEIAYTDHQLGRFLDWWDSAHPDSWVVVTADHGEGLGDGGERTHGFLLHDGTIHVPLIVRGAGFQAGTREPDPVSHVDIAPTLLALAGLEPHEGMQGRDLREGGSERSYAEALTGQYSLGLAPLLAYTDAHGRYTEGGWGAWYDSTDEGVADDAREGWQAGGEAEILAEMVASLEPGLAPEASLDPTALAQLQALGYVGGDVVSEAGSIDPRDVIDVIPLTWRARQAIGAAPPGVAERIIARLEERLPDTFGVDLLRAQLARRRGHLHEAEQRFADLYLRSPSATVALQLADISASMGDWIGATGWYQEALDIQPASPEAMAGLVRAAMGRSERTEAEVLAATYLETYPDHAELLLIRAELALADGRLREAGAYAERGLEQLPRNVWAMSTSAQVLWAQGEADPAIERLQDALRLDPYHVPLRAVLTECLLEVGRNAEAVRTVRPVARLFPDQAELQALHARAGLALDAERAR
jgi:arylsulfatase A-like enzyme/cytochrome c-type biogenesis protein CcmH/NrfG